MLKENLGLDNKVWWGTQSQKNLFEMEKWKKSSRKSSTLKGDSWKPSEGLQKPLTRGMFQKIGTKSDHEENH